MARKNPKRKNCPKSVRETLSKMNYALVGETSAVQICRWTKNSLRGDRGCWKEKFYGISSAGCCEMTPSVMWCENQCLHCWRPIEMNLGTNLPAVDDPIEILDGIVEARKKLLAGFKGRKGMDLEKLQDAFEPKLYTMSLSGEPTIYPRLGEMFKEIRKRGAVSFLVTNGLNPEVIAGFKDDELPTQIAVSTNAPNEKLFKTWHRSTKENAWQKFNETLLEIKKLKGKVRRAIRLTLVDKGEEGEFPKATNMLDEHVSQYCDLIKKSEPDFVHVKAYKAVGYAKNRMGYDNQPWHEAMQDFANKMKKELDDYEIAAEDERSCVVMLARKGIDPKITKI